MLKNFALIACFSIAFAAPGLAGERPYPEGMRPGLSNDPGAFPDMKPIYRFTGIEDDGAPDNSGSASALICTNWGPPATIRTVLENQAGPVTTTATQSIATGETITGSTKHTAIYVDDFILKPDPSAAIERGSLLVYSTSPNVECAAAHVDPGNAVPVFTVTLPSRRLTPHAPEAELLSYTGSARALRRAAKGQTGTAAPRLGPQARLAQ